MNDLARRLGTLDAVLIVMGGIVGSGIFVNPHVVARFVPDASLVLAAWGVGGLMALAGAFIWAELGVRRPDAGGQYVVLRDAFHPSVAFLYGWALLVVIQSGGMAAVSVAFARYLAATTGSGIDERWLAAGSIVALTAINAAGVRAGSTVQGVLMVLKIGAIAALVVVGLSFPVAPSPPVAPGRIETGGTLAAFGAALIPVFFAYGGWQTAGFVAGEMKDPRRTLPRALLVGVAAVVALYVGVTLAALRTLGAGGLAAAEAPASEVMRRALGEPGARFIALGIAVSTLGFLSQSMLTTPRVYFAMAEDGLFFRSVSRLSARTRAPVAAIALQGGFAAVLASTGTYERIVGYVVSMDFVFFALTASALFVLRHREGPSDHPVPGHPWTTGAFIAACAIVVARSYAVYPKDSCIGLALTLAGIPAYLAWRRRTRYQGPSPAAPTPTTE